MNSSLTRNIFLYGAQLVARVNHHGYFFSIHCHDSDWNFEQVHLQIIAILNTKVASRLTLRQFLSKLFQYLTWSFQSSLIFYFRFDVRCGVIRSDFNNDLFTIRHLYGNSHVLGLQEQNIPFLDTIITSFCVVIAQQVSIFEEVLLVRWDARFVSHVFFDGSKFIPRIHHHWNVAAVHGTNNTRYLVQVYIDIVSITQTHILGSLTNWQLLAQLLQDLARCLETRLCFNLVFNVIAGIFGCNVHWNLTTIRQGYIECHCFRLHVQDCTGSDSIISCRLVIIIQQAPILVQFLVVCRHP
mmetsp:Transcript_15460/g.33745  ORF Transcript_15460/g.33745 Transcript_15460/m.33745 type:complete len:298 (+) Transcript_15460:2450-3343(+)